MRSHEVIMGASSLNQIEESVRQLPLHKQLELMEWSAQTIRRQPLAEPKKLEDQLIAMANDSDIRRELAAIEAEFAGTKTDGLDEI
jgi:hypothetical protein